MDNQWFYVKGDIELPVKDSTEVFIRTVRVSLNHEDFDRASKHWDRQGREKEPPDHPLAVEQREGISRERIHEIAEKLLHPRGPDFSRLPK